MIKEGFLGLFGSSNNKKTPIEKEVIAKPYKPVSNNHPVPNKAVAPQNNPASNKAIVGGVTVNRSTVKNMNVMRQKPIIETNRKNINALSKITNEIRQEAIKAEAIAKTKVKQFAIAQKHAEIAKAEFMKRKTNMNSKEVALKEAQNYAIKMKGEAARREMERAVKNIRNVELVKENIKKQPINLTRFNHAINVVNLKGGTRNMQVQTVPSSKTTSTSTATSLRNRGAFEILTNRMRSQVNRTRKRLEENNKRLNQILNSYRTPSRVKVFRKPLTGNVSYNYAQQKATLTQLNVARKEIEKLLSNSKENNSSKIRNRENLRRLDEQYKLLKSDINKLKRTGLVNSEAQTVNVRNSGTQAGNSGTQAGNSGTQAGNSGTQTENSGTQNVQNNSQRTPQ